MKEIPLTKGYVALIDDEDYTMISASKWHVGVSRGKAYAKDNRSRGMHCVLLGFTGIDHGDGNGLNNQRYNLRAATPRQNAQNRPKQRGSYSSRFKGVGWHKKSGKWQAYIRLNRISKALGLYEDEVDAAQIYNFHAEELFGEFALLNTPDMGLERGRV